MKLYLTIAITAAILLSGACTRKDHSITLVEQNHEPLMVMNLKSIRDSTRINLSGIASDLRFIPLETLPECLISSASYYITNDYILARTRSGIYQFDIDGNFIRLLVNYGQGPQEYTMADWLIDEDSGRLILSDEQKTGYFLCFDLKTGEYLGDIPKAINGVTREFTLTNDESLACVPYLSPGDQVGPYYVYWQDFKGNLTDTFSGPADLAIFRGTYLETIPEGYRYMLAYSNKDTIYSLLDKKLIPFLAFNHGEEVPENREAIGYRNMKIAWETDRYLVLNKQQLTGVKTSADNRQALSYEVHEYLLDKHARKAYLLSGVYNDFVGARQPAVAYRILPNSYIYCSLQSLELLGMAERAISDLKSDQRLIGRMEEIRERIGREDNPVLVVGKIK